MAHSSPLPFAASVPASSADTSRGAGSAFVTRHGCAPAGVVGFGGGGGVPPHAAAVAASSTGSALTLPLRSPPLPGSDAPSALQHLAGAPITAPWDPTFR